MILIAITAPLVYADSNIEWRHRATQSGVTLTANPLGAEQRTSFYLARGFPAAIIRPYAQTCAFSFGMQNESAQTLTIRLAEWTAIDAEGKMILLHLPEAWDAQWESAGVSQSARIAFRWAQFQSENTFEPGDWIMGMASFEAMPPASFRLIARYHDQKEHHEIVLDKLACVHD